MWTANYVGGMSTTERIFSWSMVYEVGQLLQQLLPNLTSKLLPKAGSLTKWVGFFAQNIMADAIQHEPLNGCSQSIQWPRATERNIHTHIHTYGQVRVSLILLVYPWVLCTLHLLSSKSKLDTSQSNSPHLPVICFLQANCTKILWTYPTTST